jgi:hypothetical protein
VDERVLKTLSEIDALRDAEKKRQKKRQRERLRYRIRKAWMWLNLTLNAGGVFLLWFVLSPVLPFSPNARLRLADMMEDLGRQYARSGRLADKEVRAIEAEISEIKSYRAAMEQKRAELIRLRDEVSPHPEIDRKS